MFSTTSEKSATICHPFIFKKSFLIFTLFFLAVSTNSTAQSKALITTLEKTDKLINEGRLDEAYKIMKRYQMFNEKELMATWKTAQLAYWNWDIANAKMYYKNAIELDQKNYDVKYDYSKMLFAIGNYDQASLLLNDYRTYDSKTPEVWLYSIKSYYYNNELKKALQLYEELPQELIYNYDLTTLRDEIKTSGATTINLSGSYIDDNQPMQTLTPRIRISKMHNSYLNWYVEGLSNTFSNDTLNSNSQTVKIGNIFNFNDLKLRADVSVGPTILSNADESAVIGGVLLSKKIANGFSLNAEISRNPYYYSLPSSTNFVIQDNLGIALAVSDLYKFSGNAHYQEQRFNDDNSISVASFWFLSPSLGTSFFKAKIGYSYEAMDSDSDNYTAVKSLSEVIEDIERTTFIEGRL